MKVYTNLVHGFWAWTLYPLSARQRHLCTELKLETSGYGLTSEGRARDAGIFRRRAIRAIEQGGS